MYYQKNVLLILLTQRPNKIENVNGSEV